MSKPVGIGQSHNVISILANNVDWSQLDGDTLQKDVIEDPVTAGRRFTEFLKNGARMVVTIVLSVFKTIKVGVGPKNADEFRAAFTEAGCKISDWANDLLDRPQFTAASRAENIDLIVLTTAELTGNKNGGTTDEVFAGAARLGLDKCQPADGPELRLQYLDQPLGEWLLIGMEPMTDSNGSLHVFSVVRSDGGLWLSARYAGPGSHWGGVFRWVFRRRR